jgi:hypothetical protein
MLATPNLALTEPSAREQRREAQQSMWRWFQEWATIARTVVTSKRLRIYIGISRIPQAFT